MKNALVIAALASSLTVICQAAPVPENLLACSKVEDPAERVKCYDAQIEAMKATSPAASPAAAAASPPQQNAATSSPIPPRQPSSAASSAAPAVPAPAAASVSAGSTAAQPARGAAAAGSSPAQGAAAATPSPPARSPDAKFGIELLPPSERPTESEQERTLLSSITAMHQIRPKTYLISLANGQVWLQEGTQVTSFIRVGEGAHIKKGTLGSYRLWTDGLGEKNWVRVTRVQ